MERVSRDWAGPDGNVFSFPASMSFDSIPGLHLVRGKPVRKGRFMRIVVSDFISLDGVVQAPGNQAEDTDVGFRHGGWSMPYFDPGTMGPAIGEIMATSEALL